MPELQSSAAPFFAPWGGNGTAMALAIGEKPVTVNQWRARGSIPARYWPKIIDAAAKQGHVFSLEQFAEAFLQAQSSAA